MVIVKRLELCAVLTRWIRMPFTCILLLLLIGVAQTVREEVVSLPEEISVLRWLPDANAQSRQQLGAELYDTLTAADAVLPHGASVLLVTPGLDVRHREYVAFHRALYYLAPRPVWWMNPAPSDGTSEARWWTPAPLSAESIASVAKSKSTRFILFYQTPPPPGFRSSIEITANASIVSLDGVQLRGADRNDSPPCCEFATLAMGIAVIFAIGYLLLQIAVRLGYLAGRIEAMALAWALGAGVISVALLWLNAVGLRLSTQIAVITISSAAMVFIFGVTRARAAMRARAGCYGRDLQALLREFFFQLRSFRLSRSTWFQILLVVLIAAILLHVALLAVGRPLTVWDSWVTYAMKARIIFLDGDISAGVFADPSRSVTHLDYPLQLPLVEAWTYAWAGSADDRLAGIPAVFYFISLLGICYGWLRRLEVKHSRVLVAVAALAGMTSLNGLGGAALADLPLAVCATMTCGYLVIWLETKSTGALFIAALAGGLMPWIKREGIVLLGVLCLAVIVLNWRQPRAFGAVALVAIAAFFLSGGWWAFVLLRGIQNTDFQPLTMATFTMNLGRLPVIARWVLPSLLSANSSFVWLLATIVGISALRARRRVDSADLLFITAFVYLGLISFGYVFSNFAPYQQHIVSSIDRLLAHVTPLLVLWIAHQGVLDNRILC